LVGTSDARGCGENILYDNYGRRIAEDFSPCDGSAGSPPDTSTGVGAEVLYKYDGYSRLSEVDDRAERLVTSYDNRNRVIGTTTQIALPGAPDAALSSYTSQQYTT